MIARRFRGPAGQRLMSPVIRRLNAFQPLSPRLADRLADLERRTEVASVGRVVVDLQSYRPRPRYLVEGWACRYRMLPDGRRQLFRLLIPGDGVGICLRGGSPPQSQATTLTKAVLVDASPMLDAPDEEFEVLAGRVAAFDETLLMDQIVRLGRQSAYERAAHLLVELGARFKMAGIGEADAYRFPLTQEVLADMLGLSIVHVNRTLQQLKRDGLIRIVRGEMQLLDLKALTTLSDYQRPRILAPAEERAEVRA